MCASLNVNTGEGDFMLHLNNESLTERWREGMVEVGLRSPEDRSYVVTHTGAAYDKSMQRGGMGPECFAATAGDA